MRKAYSVSQINAYIKNMFTQDYLLHSVLVRGEVSNCKYHSSGHIYFTLKDASGTLSCVMFAGRRRGLSFPMKEGDQVIAAGAVDVYTRDGRYQLYADRIILDGIGALNEKYEQLKRKLEEQGMFDEQYKQPIPKYIRTLGVVTAPTGAAVQDIINISRRRNPHLRIILYPAIVQGDRAADSVIDGIHALENLGVDTIIIGRGGGSLEDLWAFNEERLAEAVFDCTIPIISAVGHETDTVITDYVADLRAPTPSAAAELAVFDYSIFAGDLEAYAQQFSKTMLRKVRDCRDRAEGYRRHLRLLSPEQKLREKRMFLAQAQDRFKRSMERKIEKARISLAIRDRYRIRMEQKIEKARAGLSAGDRLRERMNRKLESRRHRLQILAAGMDAASPLKRLSGGYGFVTGEKGENIVSAGQVSAGDTLKITLRDGFIKARAEEVRQND